MVVLLVLLLTPLLIATNAVAEEESGIHFFGSASIATADVRFVTVSESFVYVVTSAIPGRIEKLSLPNFSFVSAYTAATGEQLTCAGNDGTHGYFGAQKGTSLTAIVKIRLADMASVGRYAGGPTDYVFNTVAIGTRGFGYFGGLAHGFQGTTGSSFQKITLSTMTSVASSIVSGNSCLCTMIDSSETFAYVTTSSGAAFHKVRLTDMKIVLTGDSLLPSYTFVACFVHPLDDTIGFISGNGGVTQKWDLTTMTKITSIYATDTGFISTGARLGNYIYLGQTQSATGRIVKLSALTGNIVADIKGTVNGVGEGFILFSDNERVYALVASARSVSRYGFCNPSSHFFDGATCSRCPGGLIGCNSGPSFYCSNCVACGPGTFSSPDGASCTLCGVGTYAASAGSSSCDPCPGASRPGLSACVSLGCPSGTYEASNGSCVSCAAGEYSATSGSVACSMCPGGTFSNVVGANSSSFCLSCIAGSYSDPGSSNCTPCPAGTYSTRRGASSSAFCLFCPAGTWSSVLGSNASENCFPCIAGTYSAVVAAVAQDTCTACVAGTFSSSPGASSVAYCTACPAGSFGNVSASSSSSSCHACPAGSYSLSGATQCIECDEGTYGPKVGAKSSAACVSCPPGTYQTKQGATSLTMCEPCPAGTYNTGYGASSVSDCIRCPLGSFSSRIGSPSPTSCELCHGGTYGDALGAVNCTLCPPGTFSGAVGAIDASVCLPCAAGRYSNISVAAEQGGGVVSCAACPAGNYQNATGSTHCNACPRGAYNTLSGATACAPCAQGTFCNVDGCITCQQCPQDSYQPNQGAHICVPCTAALSALPEPVSSSQSAEHAVSVCSPLQHSFTVNWGSTTDPSILYADARVAITTWGALDNGTSNSFDWLTISVLKSTHVLVTAVSVPSTPLRNVIVLGVNVTQTCRRTPWTSYFKLIPIQLFPSFSLSASSAFDFAVTGAVSVKACPDFEFRFSVSVGSCPDKTVIRAMRVSPVDSSALTAVPEFVRFTFDKGTLSVYGTVPAGAVSPLVIVAVAFLDGSQFVSSDKVSVVRIEEENAPRFNVLDALQVVACPYVRVVFTVIPAACGLTTLSASLEGGLPLPSFLAAYISNSQIIVSGMVPEGTTSLAVRGTATVIGSLNQSNYSSTAVRVVRPVLVSPLAVSVDVSSDDSAAQEQQVVVNGTRTINVVARYGVAVRLALRLVDPTGTSGSAAQCTSQTLLVGSNDGQPLSGVSDFTSVPSWLPTITMTSSSIVFAGMPGRSVVSGERSDFYVLAFDGIRNPAVHVVVTVVPSLIATVRQRNSTASNATALVLGVTSPSPIVSVSAQLPAAVTANARLALVCPPTGVASAICSFDPVSGALSAFGTVDGVNKVLFGLRLAVSSTSLVSLAQDVAPNSDVAFVVSDSVNPSPLVVTIPASDITAYDGVRLVAPIFLFGTVGKPLVTSLSGYFVTPGGSATFEIVTFPALWIHMSVAGLVTGVPHGPAGVFSGSFIVYDMYVTRTIAFDINVSMPQQPRLVEPRRLVTQVVAESSVVSDANLDPSMFFDPENGTLQFQLRLSSTASTILPMFISFDESTLHLSLSPTVADVGSYTLELLALSEFRSAEWHGNASCQVSLIVHMSWKDFFQQLYEIVGYVTFVISAIGIPWVFRAFLYNTLRFRHYHQVASPISLIRSRSFVVCDPRGDNPIPATALADVAIHPLGPRKLGFFRSHLVPQYVDKLLRQQANPFHSAANIGVPWAIQTFSGGTRVIRIDSVMLTRLVNKGEIPASQELFFVATHSSWIRRDMVAVSFCFVVSDVLGGQDKTDGDVFAEYSKDVPLMEDWGSDDHLLPLDVEDGGSQCSDPHITTPAGATLDAEICSLRLLLLQLQNRVLELEGSAQSASECQQDPYQHTFSAPKRNQIFHDEPAATLASIFGDEQ